jgi:hypothetical protein
MIISGDPIRGGDCHVHHGIPAGVVMAGITLYRKFRQGGAQRWILKAGEISRCREEVSQSEISDYGSLGWSRIYERCSGEYPGGEADLSL